MARSSRYGEVVGNFPSVSSFSRCALSLASCDGLSFDLNVPLGGAPCGGAPGGAPYGGPLGAVPCGGPPGGAPSGGLVGVLVALVVLVVAAPLEAAPKTVAPTAPPASNDPAIAAVNMPLRIEFTVTFRQAPPWAV
jgi:hypothetical protein